MDRESLDKETLVLLVLGQAESISTQASIIAEQRRQIDGAVPSIPTGSHIISVF